MSNGAPNLRVVDVCRRHRRVARAVRVHASAQRRHQREHLERGPGLAGTLRREVELRLRVVGRRRHRDDVAVLRVDRDDRRRRADRAHLGLDRVARHALLVEFDRRMHDEAAELDRLGAVLLDQLVLDVVEEVALAAAAEVVGGLETETARLCLGGLLERDHAELGHLVEHVVAAALGPGDVLERRVQRRRLRQAGEQRRLAELEALGALVEVDPGGRLGADRGLAADRAVRRRVQVLLEEPVLRMLVLELLRQLRLADLALVAGEAVACAVGRVEVLHQLHRQRRAALDGLLVDEVLDRGADDALVVDALVLVEALVLDRDGRVLEHLRQVVAAHGPAQLVGGDEAQARAVGGEHLGVRARVALLQRGDRRGGGGGRDDPADHGQARRCRCRPAPP